MEAIIVALIGSVTTLLVWWGNRKNGKKIDEVSAEVKSTNGRPTGEHVVHASETTEAVFTLLVDLDKRFAENLQEQRAFRRDTTHRLDILSREIYKVKDLTAVKGSGRPGHKA